MRALLLSAASVALVAACSRPDSTPADSVGAPAAAATPPAATAPDTANADRDFLRRMSDHHEGLVQMATAAMTKASKPATRGDAHELHTKQAAERDSMIAMLRSSYGDSHGPTVMPENRAQNDSLQSLSGATYDRTFYRMVIDHHRAGIAMIDSIMPRLGKDEVRRMAEKMKADQAKEIAEFQRKS